MHESIHILSFPVNCAVIRWMIFFIEDCLVKMKKFMKFPRLWVMSAVHYKNISPRCCLVRGAHMGYKIGSSTDEFKIKEVTLNIFLKKDSTRLCNIKTSNSVEKPQKKTTRTRHDDSEQLQVIYYHNWSRLKVSYINTHTCVIIHLIKPHLIYF